MFHHYSKCLILEYLFLYASIIIKIFINNCHNYQILYLKKKIKFSYKIGCKLRIHPYLIFFFIGGEL